MVTDAQSASPMPAVPSGALYWRAARREIQRVLSWQDREPFSRTYGCFDRTYWCWKFSDFPGARFQEGVFTLAHLFTTALEENRLYREPRALEWTRAGLGFWQGLQRRDGSFDEAYPFEHSLAATAFTGFYVGEAFLRTRDALSDPNGSLGTFARAGDWLCRNDERHGVLSNHLAAAAVALYVIYRITGDERFERRCWHFVQRIYDHQSREGWYEEYGGADPGYQTLCTFYLARLWQYTGDTRLQESLARSVSFLKHCIHPNGTVGGEYGSRNTEFFFPAGCEILAAAIPDAASIAQFMRPRVTEERTAGLPAMDPQNMFPMLNNYLFAADYAAALDTVAPELPCATVGEWWFPDAGLLFTSTPTYYAIVGLAKGGVVRIYDRVHRTLAVSDCGYVARLRSGAVVSTQQLQRRATWNRDPGACTVEAAFVPLLRRVPATWLFVLFRAFSITFGRAQAVAYWLKNGLVQFLMRPPAAVPLRLTRRVELGPHAVMVTDEIVADGDGLGVVECRRAQKFANVHMGSSRYFQWQELDARLDAGEDCAQELTERGQARVVWSWDGRAARRDVMV